MNGKLISIVAVSAAVITAAVAAIFVINGREAVARAEQAKAESQEQAAKDAARQAKAEQAASEAKAAAEESARKTAEENRKAKEAERATADFAREKAREDRQAAQAANEKAAAEAKQAEAVKKTEQARAEAAKAEAEKAKALAAAEAEKAAAAEAALEKERLVAEKVIAEAKAYELKQLDLASFERELLEYKRELDEREVALHPEKTIEDLAWVSTDDTVFDENGVAQKTVKVPYLAENDKNLPRQARALAKVERLDREASAAGISAARETTVGILEKLYADAVRSDRVVDAEFYRSTIKSMYPDWKYRPPEKKEEVKE